MKMFIFLTEVCLLASSKSVLVWVMAWYQTAKKPLPDPIMIKFYDA